MVPVFLWLLLGADRPAVAGWVLFAVGVTDWIDGYLARKLNQVSELGKLLDPIADRLAIVAALIGGWIAGVVPWWVALALLVRETLVGLMALWLATRTRTRIEVRYIGKMATWAVYGGLWGFYIYAGTDWTAFLWITWLYMVPGLILYYVVAVQYVGDVRRLLRETDAPVSSGVIERGET